jgi:hypothetical protein
MRIEFPGNPGRLLLLALAVLVAGCSGGAASPASLATATLLPAASPTRLPATTAPPTVTLTRPAPTATAPAATSTPVATAGPTASATPDPAVEVVLAYLAARIEGDANVVTALVCQAWKGPAVTEAISFRSMNARLEDVVCTANGSSGSFTLVGCTGKMITTYGTETREWDLSSFV